MLLRSACLPVNARRLANDRPAWRCAPFVGEHQPRRRRGSLVQRTISTSGPASCPRGCPFERQSGSRPWPDRGASSSPFVGHLQTNGPLPLRTISTSQPGALDRRAALPVRAAAAAHLSWLERDCRLAGKAGDRHDVIVALDTLAWDETRVRANAETRASAASGRCGSWLRQRPPFVRLRSWRPSEARTRVARRGARAATGRAGVWPSTRRSEVQVEQLRVVRVDRVDTPAAPASSRHGGHGR